MDYLPPLPKKPQTILVGDIPITLYIVDDGMWLLTDDQVGTALGLQKKSGKKHLKPYCDRHADVLEKGKHWFMKGGKLPPRCGSLRLWTKEGVIALGNLVRMNFTEADKLLTALGVEPQQRRPRIEPQVWVIVEAAFDGIYPVEHPYSVAGYLVDIYFPILNIAVEIDEHGHSGYNPENEKLREARIQEELNCKIVRFNPHAPGHNVGNLINSILRHAMNTLQTS